MKSPSMSNFTTVSISFPQMPKKKNQYCVDLIRIQKGAGLSDVAGVEAKKPHRHIYPPDFEEVTRPLIVIFAEPLAASLLFHNRSVHL